MVKERLKEAVSDLRRTASKTSDKFLGENQNALRGQKSVKNDSFELLEKRRESCEIFWWRWTDSNCRLRGYEPRALTN